MINPLIRPLTGTVRAPDVGAKRPPRSTELHTTRGGVRAIGFRGVRHPGLSAWGYVVLGLAMVWMASLGCSRAYYRRQADQEVYATVRSATTDPRWALLDYTIQPDPRSRMFDPFAPDCPPMPPDDPASHRLMHWVDRKRGWRGWHIFGDTPTVDNPNWEAYLPRDGSGVVILDRHGAVEMALLHSREYQQALESLYLSALDVTLERFRFDVQFFGTNRTTSTAEGPVSGQGARSTTLSTDTDIRAEKLFATGAQLLMDFANSVVWQFIGPDRYVSVNALSFSLFQPLLRGAGRAVVLEQLTDAERALLANIRQLERFRKGFYLNILTGRNAGPPPARAGFGVSSFAPGGGATVGGYFSLLQQELEIRNQRANVAALQENVRRLEAFYEAQRIDLLQVDELRQSLYNSQIALLRRVNTYENQLDNYKITLGLPPDLDVKIEDPLLDQFNLIDPHLTDTQDEATRLLDELRQAGAMPPEAVAARILALVEYVRRDLATVATDLDRLEQALPERRASLQRLALRPEFRQRDVDLSLIDVAALEQRVKEIKEEFATLRPKLEATLGMAFYRAGDWQSAAGVLERSIEQRSGGEAEDWFFLAMTYCQLGREDYARLWYQKAVEWTVANDPGDEVLGSLAAEASELIGLPNPLAPPQKLPALTPQREKEARLELRRQRLVRMITRLTSQLTDLSLVQAAARLDTPSLVPVDLDSDEALEIARQNRLDWMNARAALVDQWRQIEVTANRLESDLNLTFSGDLTQTSNTLSGLHNTTGRLQVGVEFDAPLTRLVERNAYRQVLIAYQQARRQYYAFEDRVSQALRDTLRRIRLNQLEFELQRESVRTAIRSVVQIQLQLQAPPQPGMASQQFRLGQTVARQLRQNFANLLNSQNDFLRVWLQYEVLRRNLDFDLGTMQLDERGVWIDPGPIDRSMIPEEAPIEPLPPAIELPPSPFEEEPTPTESGAKEAQAVLRAAYQPRAGAPLEEPAHWPGLPGGKGQATKQMMLCRLPDVGGSTGRR